MKTLKRKHIYTLGSFALILSIIQQIIFLLYEFIVFIGFIADIFIVVCAILIRFNVINAEEFVHFMKNTDPISRKKGKLLEPHRFLNNMVLAIIIGTIASITIHYYFIIGVIFYAIMQIIHMRAFSGIIHLNPKYLFTNSDKNIKKSVLISTIGFIIIIPILFITMILPGWGVVAYLILPYIILLVLMTLITYWGLGYIERPIKFRLMLCLGANFFLFSDLMIGYSLFTYFYYSPLLIYPTWILAIFLMNLASLELITPSLQKNE